MRTFLFPLSQKLLLYVPVFGENLGHRGRKTLQQRMLLRAGDAVALPASRPHSEGGPATHHLPLFLAGEVPNGYGTDYLEGDSAPQLASGHLPCGCLREWGAVQVGALPRLSSAACLSKPPSTFSHKPHTNLCPLQDKFVIADK